VIIDNGFIGNGFGITIWFVESNEGLDRFQFFGSLGDFRDRLEVDIREDGGGNIEGGGE